MPQQVLGEIGLFGRRWNGLARVLFAAAAFALGLWGWQIARPATHLAEWANNLFRTLQLLTFQFPREADATLPWQLNVARFLVPTIALLESYQLILGAIRSPARLALLGLRRGHIIVVPGRGPVGRAILGEIQANNLRAIAIAPDLMVNERARMEEYRLPILPADPFVVSTWHQARADHAGMVVVCHGGDVENLNVVITVAEALGLRGDRAGPMLVAALDNEILAEQVDVALDNAARRSGLRYRRLSVPEEAARMLFLEPPLPAGKTDRSVPSHFIVVGLGPGARAVLRHALTLGQDAASAGPCITILASAQELAAEALLAAEAVPAYVARLRPMPCDLTIGVPDDMLSAMLDDAPPPVMASVCLADDAGVTVGMALARQAALRQWPQFTVAVHQGREDRFLRVLAQENTGPGHSRLRPFGGVLPPGTIQRLRLQGDDKLPRAVHQHYLGLMRHLGASGSTAVPWEDLPENVRHANRSAADHMAIKLAAIDCRIVRGERSAFCFTDAEVEALAPVEHRRWSAERLLRGWHLGARDDDRRLHPDFVAFEELDADGQEKDRDTIRSIPDVLAIAGLAIERCG